MVQIMNIRGASLDPRNALIDTEGFGNALMRLSEVYKQKQLENEMNAGTSELAGLLGGGQSRNAIMNMGSVAGNPPMPGPSAAVEPLSDTELGVAKFASAGLAQSLPKKPSLDPDLVASVKSSEGFSRKPYWDVRQWTNGWGTRASGPNDILDEAGAEQRLTEELGKAQAIVEQFAPNAPPGVKKALTSLTYNAGADWTTAGLGAAVKRGDWADAQRRFLQYNRAGGQQLAGLVSRRQREAKWFNEPAMALGGPTQAETAAAQPQAQPVQVADAGGGDRTSAIIAWAQKNPRHPTAQKILSMVAAQQLQATKADGPASVQEWEYYQKLSEPQKQEFLKLKRDGFKDVGTGFVNPATGQFVPKDLAGAERDKEVGTAQGKQIASAPGDIAAADSALDIVQSLRTDPNRTWGTGASSLFNFMPGSPGKSYQLKVNQARSGAFLTAIQQLRGMGALSNAEGQTATDAVTRLNTEDSEEGFLRALDDYEKIVRKGRAKAEQILTGTQSKNYPTPESDAAPQQDLKSKYGLE